MYKGNIVLWIWNEEMTESTHAFRKVELNFQPMKGMKINSETNHYTIHDIEWDLEEGSFDAKIILIEHRAGDSFIDVDYLAEEAALCGWKIVKTHNDLSSEFRGYCFPNLES